MYKKVNQLPVPPSPVMLCQMERHLKMAQCNHRLYSIFQTFVKEVIIETQSILIRLDRKSVV